MCASSELGGGERGTGGSRAAAARCSSAGRWGGGRAEEWRREEVAFENGRCPSAKLSWRFRFGVPLARLFDLVDLCVCFRGDYSYSNYVTCKCW